MKKSTGTILFWGISLLVIVAAVFVVVKFSDEPVVGPGDAITGAAVELGTDDWTKGDESASVVLIEYSDFQCPACSVYSPIIRDIVNEFGDKIVVAYRHFPLKSIHANAEASALAAEAAGFQGKFWEMHDKLFDSQKEWSSLGDPTETFVGYAEEIGLNLDRFKGDMVSEDAKEELAADMELVRSAGLNSTPTFVLNGKKIQPGSYEQFRTLVRDEIEAAS